jgi:hypothetical protein
MAHRDDRFLRQWVVGSAEYFATQISGSSDHLGRQILEIGFQALSELCVDLVLKMWSLRGMVECHLKCASGGHPNPLVPGFLPCDR